MHDILLRCGTWVLLTQHCMPRHDWEGHEYAAHVNVVDCTQTCRSIWNCLGLLQELQAMDLELQELTGESQADPFLLYLHGLVQIDRQACSLRLSGNGRM